MSCIYTAKYLVSAGAPPVEGGAFVVDGRQIVATGSLLEMKKSCPGVEVVDFGDAIISPLLVNAHTHLELSDYSVWKERLTDGAEPTTFVDWILQLVGIKRNLEEDDYRLSLRHGIEQSLTAGTGVVGDILSQFGCRDLYSSALLDGHVFLETLGHHSQMIADHSERLHKVLDEGGEGSLTFGVAPHSPYTISAEYLSRIYRWCRDNNCRCSTHVAESPEEVRFIAEAQGDLAEIFYPCVGWCDHLPQPSGMGPVEYLDSRGGLYAENLLVHGVHLTDSEIALLAEKQMGLVLCPRSNAQLGVGKAPAAQLLRSGVKLALGTDSLASNDSLSIWDEMAFAHSWFDGKLDAPTLYSMATLGGAAVLGLVETHASIEIGKVADFQVLQPQLLPDKKDIYDYFVSPGCTDDIVQVYHRGKLKV